MKFICTKLISKDIFLDSKKNLILSYCMESIEYNEYEDDIKNYFLDMYGTNVFDYNGNIVEEYQPRNVEAFRNSLDKEFLPIGIIVDDADYINWIEETGMNPIQQNYPNNLLTLGYEVISAFGMYSAILDNVKNITFKTNYYGLLDKDIAQKFKLELEYSIPEHSPWMIIGLVIDKKQKAIIDNLHLG